MKSFLFGIFRKTFGGYSTAVRGGPRCCLSSTVGVSFLPLWAGPGSLVCGRMCRPCPEKQPQLGVQPSGQHWGKCPPPCAFPPRGRCPFPGAFPPRAGAPLPVLSHPEGRCPLLSTFPSPGAGGPLRVPSHPGYLPIPADRWPPPAPSRPRGQVPPLGTFPPPGAGGVLWHLPSTSQVPMARVVTREGCPPRCGTGCLGRKRL